MGIESPKKNCEEAGWSMVNGPATLTAVDLVSWQEIRKAPLEVFCRAVCKDAGCDHYKCLPKRACAAPEEIMQILESRVDELKDAPNQELIDQVESMGYIAQGGWAANLDGITLDQDPAWASLKDILLAEVQTVEDREMAGVLLESIFNRDYRNLRAGWVLAYDMAWHVIYIRLGFDPKSLGSPIQLIGQSAL